MSRVAICFVLAAALVIATDQTVQAQIRPNVVYVKMGHAGDRYGVMKTDRNSYFVFRTDQIVYKGQTIRSMSGSFGDVSISLGGEGPMRVISAYIIHRKYLTEHTAIVACRDLAKGF